EELTKSVIRAFRAVAHRIEYTATVNGVRYYDDSKGTNPDAAIQGIRAMTSKTVLIGGGYDKGSEFDEWIDAFGGKVKLLILMGVTAEKIAETAKRHGFTEIAFVASMEEAVRLAAKTALPGEAVLLSPACASWGMFKDYEERGDIFKALVRKMEEQ
ncbi:MAG: UDP-N-acetylmuramoyl-L-alanine--D-glutamate ligase, partial [Lachnospiraceae bacterium]|nr:UDP-N-acetylmuramoyl-L-alanine--D-glutamate ligase [Lachnospiraceae bacterium]